MVRYKWWFYFSSFYKRCLRLLLHLISPIFKNRSNAILHPHTLRQWLIDIPIYVLDIIAFPELIETIFALTKWNSIRPLDEDEKCEAYNIFGEHLLLDPICIDRNAKIGTQSYARAYVSFNTVNYRKQISMQMLIHELVHVWQYQKYGSVYIRHALTEHKSIADPYDFGGLDALYFDMVKGKKLNEYGIEQQAEIIETYYAALGLRHVSSLQLATLKYFRDQLG
jgi:hypothetical protein